MQYKISAITTLITVSVVGGLPFIIAVIILGSLYYNGTWWIYMLILIFTSSVQPPKYMAKLLEICDG